MGQPPQESVPKTKREEKKSVKSDAAVHLVTWRWWSYSARIRFVLFTIGLNKLTMLDSWIVMVTVLCRFSVKWRRPPHSQEYQTMRIRQGAVCHRLIHETTPVSWLSFVGSSTFFVFGFFLFVCVTERVDSCQGTSWMASAGETRPVVVLCVKPDGGVRSRRL